MVFLNYYVYSMMFFLAMFLFTYLYNQVLLTLMMLEFMMLSLLLVMMMMLMKIVNFMLMMYFLVVVVCESVMGLTLLILIIRSYGNDNMNSMNLILW